MLISNCFSKEIILNKIEERFNYILSKYMQKQDFLIYSDCCNNILKRIKRDIKNNLRKND